MCLPFLHVSSNTQAHICEYNRPILALIIYGYYWLKNVMTLFASVLKINANRAELTLMIICQKSLDEVRCVCCGVIDNGSELEIRETVSNTSRVCYINLCANTHGKRKTNLFSVQATGWITGLVGNQSSAETNSNLKRENLLLNQLWIERNIFANECLPFVL